MFQAGQQIGSYILIHKLGKGGFGEVWLAEKRSQLVTKKVAVKLPHEDQINIEAIRQEAALWEQASGHANVLPIIDADVIDGQVLIVSEYADGGSLQDKIKREGKLPIQKAVEMSIGILSGLEFLHNKRIIHRDIKPQNILLQGETPRLADFGISRAMQTSVISSTIIGTDAYMSPESFDGKRSVQTDIWSVGVVLYQLLVGTLPFPQEHPSERMFAIFSKEFAPLGNEIPADLRQIVSRALAKQTENRYQTTPEMRNDLQKALLHIAHPTFAPTEPFRIPLEHLPPISTIVNDSQTDKIEKENIVSPQNFNYPVPTQSAFQQESVVTNFKEAPQITNESAFSPSPEANKTHATKFQIVSHQEVNSPPKSGNSLLNVIVKNQSLEYVIAGIVGFFLIIGLVFIVSGGLLLNFFQKSTTVTSSNANSASSSNSGSATKLNIEVRVTTNVSFVVFIDGKSQMCSLDPNQLSTFSPQNSFKIRYYKGFADQIQLKINDKTVALPKAEQSKDNSIEFEVTKDNLNQVLQNSSNANKTIVNTNTNSNANVNSTASNPPLTTEMNIEFTATEPVAFFIHIDGSKEDAVILAPTMVKKITPQKSLEMSYSPEKSSVIRLKINGKSISIPNTASSKNAMVKFVITKDDLNEILESGKVTKIS